jgi:hypothetical protein
MKKSIVITGPISSGKSGKSKSIASEFDKDEVVFIDYPYTGHPDRFVFSKCTKKTKLVVIDEMKSLREIYWIMSIIDGGLIVDKMMEDRFIIDPIFVIVFGPNVSGSDLEELGRKFSRRFDHIEIKSK